jgi:hypothetical protein
VVLFSRQPGEDEVTNLFSVSTPGHHKEVNSRSIVSHRGMDGGSGTWQCSKDRMAHDCAHIKKARDHLQKLITGDPSARDGTVQEEIRTGEFIPSMVQTFLK